MVKSFRIPITCFQLQRPPTKHHRFSKIGLLPGATSFRITNILQLQWGDNTLLFRAALIQVGPTIAFRYPQMMLAVICVHINNFISSPQLPDIVFSWSGLLIRPICIEINAIWQDFCSRKRKNGQKKTAVRLRARMIRSVHGRQPGTSLPAIPSTGCSPGWRGVWSASAAADCWPGRDGLVPQTPAECTIFAENFTIPKSQEMRQRVFDVLGTVSPPHFGPIPLPVW
ncbi:hypothetical protein HNQ81_002346 [Desulfoprunum benzoelyticum]|uniref:Uncharacterized protein n=1 Tax=Desulfoprunum benzoelyticum TaxID=1506996 RepID=A0A840V414_9BACT|nr:hypothetical protein [Desulfoprunum benzoelyticum]